MALILRLVDFRSRLRQFEYSSSANDNMKRRSPRLSQASSLRSGEQASSPISGLSKKRHARHPSDPESSNALHEGQAEIKAEIKSEDAEDKSILTQPSAKKRRSTTKERSARDPYSPTNHLTDSLRPGLTLVCIGLNPGLMTAATGHAYAHPSNRFWHILYESGITTSKHLPSETRDLMDLYSIGNTNICARPTRSGDGLTKEEMQDGAAILDNKIAEFRPEAVVIVGKGIWEAIWMKKKDQKRFKDPDFHWGWQDESLQVGRILDADGEVVWHGSKTFVATSTSGLAATLRPEEKLAIWKPLGMWMESKRAEARANSIDSEA